MFTGIVEEVGRVAWAEPRGGDLRVRIEAERVLDGLAVGDSIACGGCCLTVVAHDERAFEVELSLETVAKTAPRWREGASLNLERALAADGRFGGHVVTGHVGGTGTVLAIDAQPGAGIGRLPPQIDLAGRRVGVEGQEHLRPPRMGIGHGLRQFVGREVQPGKVAGIGGVLKAAIDGIGTGIDGGAQGGGCAGGADQFGKTHLRSGSSHLSE